MLPLKANRNRGFTLLEMMVVLVLVSLITVLLMQGFSFVVGLQERIRQQLVQIQDIELREQWFRSVVRSFHRGRNADDAQFTGNSEQFSGLVLQPLINDTGMPTKVYWAIERDGSEFILTYQEDQLEPATIMRWTTESPEFRYMDDSGNLTNTWPPNISDAGLPFGLFESQRSQALPKGVVLFDTNEQARLFWYVSISSNTLPEVDFAL